MIEFNIGDGSTLSLNLEEWKYTKNLMVEVTSENEVNYIIRNHNGIISSIPKEIISINNLQVLNNSIELPDGFYSHYVNDMTYKNEDEKFNKLFLDNLDLIFSNPELIFTHAEYFLLKPDLLFSGAIWGIACRYCIGGLLESWRSSDCLLMKNLDGLPNCNMVRIIGSGLTNFQYAELWNANEHRLILLSNKYRRELPDGIHKYLKIFAEINKKYPYKIDFQLKALEDFLSKV